MLVGLQTAGSGHANVLKLMIGPLLPPSCQYLCFYCDTFSSGSGHNKEMQKHSYDEKKDVMVNLIKKSYCFVKY